MSNRSFCILLAATLLMMGAVVSALMKYTPEEQMATQDASAAVQREEMMIVPVSGEIIRPFGAQYSEELGQWSLLEEVTVLMEAENVFAPFNGVVESVAATEGGGSCVVIRGDTVQISLRPVYGVCTFEGSQVKQGEVIGRTEDVLVIRAEQDGVPVNLFDIGKPNSFFDEVDRSEGEACRIE